jgi:hypothetical protein
MLAKATIGRDLDSYLYILGINRLDFLDRRARVIQQNFFDVVEPRSCESKHVLVPALHAGRKDVRKLRRGGFQPTMYQRSSN